MLSISITSLSIMILLPSISLGLAVTSSDMEKNCGKTILLNGDKLPGTYFSLTSGNYGSNVNCTLTIKGSTISQRIIIVVDKMDIACGGDKLIVYDGKKEEKFILNKQNTQECGTNKYYLRTTTSNTAIIQFISNADGKVGSGFRLNVAIDFPVSSCPQADGLYQCKNKYCISKLFKCDGRNWCGDNTQADVCG